MNIEKRIEALEEAKIKREQRTKYTLILWSVCGVVLGIAGAVFGENAKAVLIQSFVETAVAPIHAEVAEVNQRIDTTRNEIESVDERISALKTQSEKIKDQSLIAFNGSRRAADFMKIVSDTHANRMHFLNMVSRELKDMQAEIDEAMKIIHGKAEIKEPLNDWLEIIEEKHVSSKLNKEHWDEAELVAYGSMVKEYRLVYGDERK